jgi:hypothetical protein
MSKESESRTEQLRDEIVRMIDRYADESDMTLAETIGTLEIVKMDILKLMFKAE